MSNVQIWSIIRLPRHTLIFTNKCLHLRLVFTVLNDTHLIWTINAVHRRIYQIYKWRWPIVIYAVIWDDVALQPTTQNVDPLIRLVQQEWSEIEGNEISITTHTDSNAQTTQAASVLRRTQRRHVFLRTYFFLKGIRRLPPITGMSKCWVKKLTSILYQFRKMQTWRSGYMAIRASTCCVCHVSYLLWRQNFWIPRIRSALSIIWCDTQQLHRREVSWCFETDTQRQRRQLYRCTVSSIFLNKTGSNMGHSWQDS